MAKLDLTTNRANRRVDALEQRLETLIKDFQDPTTSNNVAHDRFDRHIDALTRRIVELEGKFNTLDKRLANMESDRLDVHHYIMRIAEECDLSIIEREVYRNAALEEQDQPADFTLKHQDDRIREDPADRYVVLLGNFNEGFVAYGPFKAGETDAFVHRHRGGMVMMLQRPR